MKKRPSIYGLMAEFEDLPSLLAATHRAHHTGYRHMDAYTPFPNEELSELLEGHHNILPKLVFAGGVIGLLAGVGLQWATNAVDYPINVGGRPLISWPAWIPVGFEMTVLLAAFATVLGMLGLNGLPMPYHPVFNVPRFALSSQDRFFLCIEADDPLFDRQETRRFLEAQQPHEISEVEH